MTRATQRAQQLVTYLAEREPDVVRLAEFVSLATRVEPATLRHFRLALEGDHGPELESFLWTSRLVEAATPMAFVFGAEVVKVLRARLATQRARLGRAWSLLKRVHANAPPALQLEEELIYALLSGARSDAKTMLRRAMVAMTADRPGVARWAARALPRLPPVVRDYDEFWYLVERASHRLGRALEPAPRERELDEATLQWARARARAGTRHRSFAQWTVSAPPGDLVTELRDAGPELLDRLARALPADPKWFEQVMSGGDCPPDVTRRVRRRLRSLREGLRGGASRTAAVWGEPADVDATAVREVLRARGVSLQDPLSLASTHVDLYIACLPRESARIESLRDLLDGIRDRNANIHLAFRGELSVELQPLLDVSGPWSHATSSPLDLWVDRLLDGIDAAFDPDNQQLHFRVPENVEGCFELEHGDPATELVEVTTAGERATHPLRAATSSAVADSAELQTSSGDRYRLSLLHDQLAHQLVHACGRIWEPGPDVQAASTRPWVAYSIGASRLVTSGQRVVLGTERMTVSFGGETREARLLRMNEARTVALIQLVQPRGDFEVLEIGHRVPNHGEPCVSCSFSELGPGTPITGTIVGREYGPEGRWAARFPDVDRVRVGSPVLVDCLVAGHIEGFVDPDGVVMVTPAAEIRAEVEAFEQRVQQPASSVEREPEARPGYYVSFCRGTARILDELRARTSELGLEARGPEVIRIGPGFNDEIMASLASASTFVALLSPAYFEAAECLWEWEAFKARARMVGADAAEAIVPIIVDPLEHDELRNLQMFPMDAPLAKRYATVGLAGLSDTDRSDVIQAFAVRIAHIAERMPVRPVEPGELPSLVGWRFRGTSTPREARRSLSQIDAFELARVRRALDQLIVSGTYREAAQRYQELYVKQPRRLFLAWNRALVADFERSLQLIDPDVMLPYWDWRALDVPAPPHAFWGESYADPGNGERLRNPLAVAVDGSPITRTVWSAESPLTEFLPRLAGVSEFQPLQNLVQQAHDVLHNLVGGRLGEVDKAAGDPLFWFLQAGADLLFYRWQTEGPQSSDPEARLRGVVLEEADLERPLEGFSKTVRDVVDIERLDYTYDYDSLARTRRILFLPDLDASAVGLEQLVHSITTGARDAPPDLVVVTMSSGDRSEVPDALLRAARVTLHEVFVAVARPDDGGPRLFPFASGAMRLFNASAPGRWKTLGFDGGTAVTVAPSPNTLPFAVEQRPDLILSAAEWHEIEFPEISGTHVVVQSLRKGRYAWVRLGPDGWIENQIVDLGATDLA